MAEQALAGRAARDDEPLRAGGEPAVEPELRRRGSVSAAHGVSSLKMTSGILRRRHHAHARSAAGPYSQTTTTSGAKL